VPEQHHKKVDPYLKSVKKSRYLYKRFG